MMADDGNGDGGSSASRGEDNLSKKKDNEGAGKHKGAKEMVSLHGIEETLTR